MRQSLSRSNALITLTVMLFALLLLPASASAKKGICDCYDLRALCGKIGGKAQGFASHGLFCVIKKQAAHSPHSLSYRMQDFPKDCAMFHKKLKSKLGAYILKKGAQKTCKPTPRPTPRPVSKAKWFRLKTMFRGKGECFEGNQSKSRVHSGAAFMDKCKNVSGQFWKMIPARNGYFRLKTMFRGKGECLEGNQSKSRVHSGAAFMDKCKNVSGQLWKMLPARNGYFRLKTMFRGKGECLEGNQSKSRVHSGAAFMDKCKNVSGQLWKMVKR